MNTEVRKRLNKRALFRSLDYHPHPGQIAIHTSKASRRIVACGVRWGKTRCAAMEGLAAAMAPSERSIGWVVAPTYDLADKVFREIVLITAEHLRHRIVLMRESDRRLILRNMAGGTSEIRAKSADNPVSLLGEGLSWTVVDEASRLKPAIWEGHLTQRLLDRKGWALLISTPRGKGWFHGLYRRGQGSDPDYASWNSPSWENPHLDKKAIEAERERLPARVFEQEYGGKFLEGDGQVFRYVRESATGDWPTVIPEATYYGGLDLARVNDYTVLVIMNERGEVVFVDRFHRIDWSAQIKRIKAATDRFRYVALQVDVTGMGDPVYEQLIESGVYVSPYTLSPRSKRALIDNLAMLLEQRKITLPKPRLWPEGIDELEAFEFSIRDSGHVGMAAPSGQHDDCVIALALAAWELRPRPVPRVFL